MLGAIVGDIVGSVYEFDNIKTTEFPLFGEDCHFTDDSILTIALAEDDSQRSRLCCDDEAILRSLSVWWLRRVVLKVGAFQRQHAIQQLGERRGDENQPRGVCV